MNNFFDSQRVQIFLQTVFGMTPFVRRGNRMVASGWMITHSCLILITYVILVSICLSELISEISGWSLSGGYLWGIIVAFELMFTNAAFPLLIIHSLIFKKRQMDLYNKVLDIDERLQKHFKMNLKPLHRAIHARNIGTALLCFTYFGAVSVIMATSYLKFNLNSRSIAIYLMVYQFEQVATGILSSANINITLVLRSRFRLLQLAQPLLLKGDNVSITTRKLRFSIWLFTFKELCSLVDAISENVGLILIVRVAHDFTLLTSQCYLIFWVYFYNRGTDKVIYLCLVLFWMLQNVVKIGVTALVNHVTINEVHIAYIRNNTKVCTEIKCLKLYFSGCMINSVETRTLDDDVRHMVSSI